MYILNIPEFPFEESHAIGRASDIVWATPTPSISAAWQINTIFSSFHGEYAIAGVCVSLSVKNIEHHPKWYVFYFDSSNVKLFAFNSIPFRCRYFYAKSEFSRPTFCKC